MTPEFASINIDGLVQVAKWISLVILTATGLCATVVLLRLLKQVEFTLAQAKFRLAHFPYVLSALSVAHAFLAWVLSQKVDILAAAGRPVATQAWTTLVNSEAFVFNNMQPRLLAKGLGPFGIDAYSAAASDTAYWCALSFAVLSIVAYVASRWPIPPFPAKPWQQLSDASAASFLAGINWYIGSVWAVDASRLAS